TLLHNVLSIQNPFQKGQEELKEKCASQEQKVHGPQGKRMDSQLQHFIKVKSQKQGVQQLVCQWMEKSRGIQLPAKGTVEPDTMIMKMYLNGTCEPTLKDDQADCGKKTGAAMVVQKKWGQGTLQGSCVSVSQGPLKTKGQRRHRAVIMKNTDDGISDRPYRHALVTGIDRYP
ncbi:hypothetical protein A6R68_08420, partial [Neotoma lepida]